MFEERRFGASRSQLVRRPDHVSFPNWALVEFLIGAWGEEWGLHLSLEGFGTVPVPQVLNIFQLNQGLPAVHPNVAFCCPTPILHC